MGDQPSLLGKASQLAVAADALAALAAKVRMDAERIAVPDAVRSLLDEIAAEIIGADDCPDLSEGPMMVGMARTFLRQALGVVEDPGRATAWDDPDPVLLQSIGRMSMSVVEAFRTANGVLPGLDFEAGGSFLDVGTGTGWLAIGTARAFPSLRVVGIDIFPAALALARGNVAGEGLDGRIELREQNAAELGAEGFDAVWVPLPFIPHEAVGPVLDGVRRALKPGGWVLPGTFAGPDGRLPELLLDLRTVRSGGHPWRGDELLGVLADHGFGDVQEVPRTWAAPVRMYAGHVPAA